MDNNLLKKGLTTVEAQKKLSEFGPNTLTRKKEVSSIRIFLSQFESPLVYILVLAGSMTLILREFTDAIVIFSAVLVNTILGFYQERKAQKALVALRRFLIPQAKVIRDKEAKMIPVSQIVPGDLVILTLGTRVPADGILVEATDFSVNEAILTGEAMPAAKKIGKGEEKNQVFMGTMVVTGIAKMMVTQTGEKTKMGQIGQSLVEIKEEKTPLQENLNHLSKILATIFGFVTIFIFTLGTLRGYHLVEMFTISVAVAVAAIPEGLMVTLTVILALGMQRLLARKALVRKLIAAETLGSVSVICADKTGTLTEGQLKVVKSDFTNLRLGQEAAILCNDMHDPLEAAMMSWVGEQLGDKEVKQINEKYPRLGEIPFSFKEKYIVTLHPGLLLISGAPEVVLKMSNLSTKEKKTWLEKFEKAGRQSYRLVGFAYKKVKPSKKIEKEDLDDFKFLGILIYEDPVRLGVKEALDEAQKAGISLKVITGDHASTAMAVLVSLGVSVSARQVMEGRELDTFSENQLKERVSEVLLFARTNPQQKLKIVKALKDKGEVVAMMGDGVNDAPALKMADIGLVVGDASDVAKETADVILLDSQFATIVHAVEEGRTIFENIKKVTLFLLSDSFTEIILIGGSLLLGLPLAVTAVQILWVNFIEDSLPAVALAFEPKEKEVMFDPPRPRLAPILNRPLKMIILFIAIFTNLVLFAIFLIMFSKTLPLDYIQTVMFVALGINSLFYIFACRTFRKTIFQKNFWENKFLLFSIIFGLFLLAAAVYFPPLQILLKTKSLGLAPWLFIFGLGVLNLIAIEVTKWFFLSRDRQFLSQR